MATNTQECVHSFSYLVKKYEDGGYTARVMEIPAIIASNKIKDKLENEIRQCTRDYLKTFDEEHEKAKEGSLKPILVSPKRGIVVEIKPFEVRC